MAARYLSREEARAFYDRFGVKQDWQRFYEGPALRDLLLHGQFESARSVFELGCGTGAFAKALLEGHLPETATYVGVDISSVMAGIARKRLSAFEGRAEVVKTDGALAFKYADGSFDRFVSNYVLDLLQPDQIRNALDEAYRLLKPGALLCLVSLTYGRTFFSRALISAWRKIFNLNPNLVGGCRPVQLRDHLREDRWKIENHKVLHAFGIPSEVVIASKLPRVA
jgi:ubiquinone/menaquinone biosynthesis C-methylase UbiE